jgi:uncharacterized 2Fe-2S/4Fe-4S cluster protein (DUF4445 family)
MRESENHEVTILPFDTTVEVERGALILDAVIKASLPFKSTCGGKGTCGECIVQVIRGEYQTKSTAAMSDHALSQGFALACETEVKGDLVIGLPKFQELSLKSIVDYSIDAGQRKAISGSCEIDPPVKKIDLQIASPTLEDNYSDMKRLEREFLKNHDIYHSVKCEYSALKKLAYAIRKDNGKLSVVLSTLGETGTIIDIVPQSEGKQVCGIACDLGTSTVALHLVDLSDGKILSTVSSYNQQIKCGEDVISRINFARKPGRLQELQSLIIGTINHLIKKAVKISRISVSDIYYATVSGNTTMIHLFLNLEPRFIREEPYVPTLNQVPITLSRDVGLDMNYEGRIFCAPAVGSYVGGDITAGMICTPILLDSDKISLFIDAGTNGELVLGNKDWLMTCACSAGPAFEGSGIKCGMPASEGAIEGIKNAEKGMFEYEIIDNEKPKGLCGSGLVDLLAELFLHGYVDRHGKFSEKAGRENIVETEEGPGFVIEKGENCFWGQDLLITENDISNLIRTKGAVYSACSVLLKSAGLSFGEIDSFYIAGGFGQHLNIENAVRIGLLPDLERDRFHYIGNSSLQGSYLGLISDSNRGLVDEIADKMTYIELNTEPRYMDEYTGALFLPHTDMKLFPSVELKTDP